MKKFIILSLLVASFAACSNSSSTTKPTVSTTTVVNTLNSTTNILQGIAAYKNGDMTGAYNALKNLSPASTNLETYSTYLNVLQNLNKNQELLTALKSGNEYFGNSKEYALNYANILASKFNDKTAAINVLENYMKTNGNNSEVVKSLADLYTSAGNVAKAASLLKSSN
ncbi:tetratricopeptide repeat protein [Fusobacterium sp. HC1336]|jgi:predicted Zn-dependent protease|uniref:tetratricopeptide repeat protein n=1 Tax=Fusobacterium sp. HC1336 TaxID=3171169 RepID=UPI003F251525